MTDRPPVLFGDLTAAIFDVDGVLVASPHERAWQEALQTIMEEDWRNIAGATDYAPDRFTTDVYLSQLAGKPRLSGARAALEYFHVPEPAERAVAYSTRKQQRIEELIDAGAFTAFEDALRFIVKLKAAGMLIAAASSSKNANKFMRQIPLDPVAGSAEAAGIAAHTLADIFDANVCGRDLAHGKPAPDIFLLAAQELHADPARCVVVEDAAAGIEAAKSAGMVALGVARLDDSDRLEAAGADLVVTTMDEVSIDALRAGRLEKAEPTGDAATTTATGASRT